MPNKVRTLDLFSGCGGLSFGLHQVSRGAEPVFETIGAIDSWAAACEALGQNLGVRPIVAGVSMDSIREAIGSQEVDLVVGGPPCQGFSTSGRRAADDPRNRLAFVFMEAVEECKPEAFIMENVSGFLSFQQGKLVNELLDRADHSGYAVQMAVLCASLHGVPQRRRRFFMVGTRRSGFSFGGGPSSRAGLYRSGCELELDEYPDPVLEAMTFDDATSDLPLEATGESRYRCAPENLFQKYCRPDARTPLAEHVAPRHSKSFVEMMSYVPQGRSAMDPEIGAMIPDRIRPRSGFPNSYARIRGDEPAPTITRNFTTPSSANCIHPRADRALSLREGARCQSFPDYFRFAGTSTDKRLMIGNAVPPLLARHLGVLIASYLGVAHDLPVQRETSAPSETHGRTKRSCAPAASQD